MAYPGPDKGGGIYSSFIAPHAKQLGAGVVSKSSNLLGAPTALSTFG